MFISKKQSTLLFGLVAVLILLPGIFFLVFPGHSIKAQTLIWSSADCDYLSTLTADDDSSIEQFCAYVSGEYGYKTYKLADLNQPVGTAFSPRYCVYADTDPYCKNLSQPLPYNLYLCDQSIYSCYYGPREGLQAAAVNSPCCSEEAAATDPARLWNKKGDSLKSCYTCLEDKETRYSWPLIGSVTCLDGKEYPVNQDYYSSGECKHHPTVTVKLYLDPEYIKQTEKERLFIPQEPINPYDDIICEVKADKADYDQNNKFEGELVVDQGLFGQKVINKRDLSYAYSDEKFNYYQWKIKGWDNGKMPSIAPDSSGINTVVSKDIINNPNIKCEVKIDENIKVKSGTKPVSLCVHMWGNTNKKPAGINGYKIAVSGGYKISSFTNIKNTQELYKDSLWKIDPFARYQTNFEYYTDLKPVNDDVTSSKSDRQKITEIYNSLPGSSQCQGMNQYYFYTNRLKPKSSLAYDNAVPAAENSIGKKVISIFSSSSGLATLAHELGHSFDLSDEYVYNPSYGYYNLIGGGAGKSNCVSSSVFEVLSFSPDYCKNFKIFYPNYDQGCYLGCTNKGDYRSSYNSIMNRSGLLGSNKFNKISCSAILGKIKPKTKPLDNWKECGSMDLQGPFDGDTSLCNTTNVAGAQTFDCGTLGVDSKCVFAGEGKDCMAISNSDFQKRYYGSCHLDNAKPNGPFICDVKTDWQCNKSFGCMNMETVGTRACNLTNHKCVYQECINDLNCKTGFKCDINTTWQCIKQ